MNCLLCNQKGDEVYVLNKSIFFKCFKDELMWIQDGSDLKSLYFNYHAHIKKNSLFGFISSFFSRDIIDIGKLSNKGRMLDVGCGAGDVMVAFNKKGWNTMGIEVDSAVVDFARKRGLSVYLGDLLDKYQEMGKFDCIVLNHVIEHLDDPEKILRVCESMLVKGGNLIIATPNLNSLGHRLFKDKWRGLEIPYHRWIFSCKSIFGLLTRIGYLNQREVKSFRMVRGVFVSSLNLKIRKFKYISHFAGLLFLILEIILVYLGYNIQEELFVVAKKK